MARANVLCATLPRNLSSICSSNATPLFRSVQVAFQWCSEQKHSWRSLFIIALWCLWNWRNAKIFQDSKEPLKSSLHRIIAFHDMMPVKKAKMKRIAIKRLMILLLLLLVLFLMGPGRIIFVDVGSTLLWIRSCNTFYPGMMGLTQTAWPSRGFLQDCLPFVYFLTCRAFQFSVIQNQ